MPTQTSDIYALLEQAVQSASKEAPLNIQYFQLGLTWSCCQVNLNGKPNLGFAMSPNENTRLLNWPGTIAGQDVKNIVPLLHSWSNFDATLALATTNAVINHPNNSLLRDAQPINQTENANLSPFYYFRSKLERKKVIIIGHYPNIENVLAGLDYTILERNPTGNDLPDSAAETLIPEADWVFITSTSIINKTFHRLCQLAKNAVTVLMGPSTPWLPGLESFGVDYIAGVQLTDLNKAKQIAAEGGGKKLFDGGVNYALLDISNSRLQNLKQQIALTADKRKQLKQHMDSWYQNGNKGRFPNWDELDQVDKHLSKLDLAYKRLWDASS